MNFSTSTVANEFPKQVALLFIDAFEEANKRATRIIWDFAITTLVNHWLLITGIFAATFVFFFLLALVGQWGSLYSLTYWTLYGIVVFVIGLIWGPEVFVSDWYGPIYLIIIWPFCYWFTGCVWDRFNLRR